MMGDRGWVRGARGGRAGRAGLLGGGRGIYPCEQRSNRLSRP